MLLLDFSNATINRVLIALLLPIGFFFLKNIVGSVVPGMEFDHNSVNQAASNVRGGDDSGDSNDFFGDYGSLLSLHPWIFKRGDWEDVNRNESFFCRLGVVRRDWQHGVLMEDMILRMSRRSKRTPRENYRFCIKGHAQENGSTSCVRNGFQVDESILNSLPLDLVGLRSVYVTDGGRVLCNNPSYLPTENCSLEADDVDSVVPSKNGYGVADYGIGAGMRSAGAGIPRLPRIWENDNKSKWVADDIGSMNSSLGFVLGLSIGAAMTLFLTELEVGKLKSMLKNSMNVVQDLQEELEMKDLIVVEELSTNDTREGPAYGYSCTAEAPLDSNHRIQADGCPSNETDEYGRRKNYTEDGDAQESFAKLEAELQAELEKLEQFMNASSPPQRKPVYIELDLEGDFVGSRDQATRADADEAGEETTSSTSTTGTHHVNHAVSPMELTIRLHEVIESRLEERVVELKRELQRSKLQVHALQADEMDPLRMPPSSSSSSDSCSSSSSCNMYSCPTKEEGSSARSCVDWLTLRSV